MDGQRHTVQPETTLLIGRAAWHTVHNTGNTQMRLLWMIAPAGLGDWFRAIGRPRRPGEEVIEGKFAVVLERLEFDREVLAWVRAALRASHADEKQEHEAAIARLQDEYNRLQGRNRHDVCGQAGWSDRCGLLRPDGGAMERRAGAMPARHRTASKCQPVLPGGGDTPPGTGAVRRAAYSIGRKRPRSAACSISWFRTAPGRAGNWRSIYANPLISLRKRGQPVPQWRAL